MYLTSDCTSYNVYFTCLDFTNCIMDYILHDFLEKLFLQWLKPLKYFTVGVTEMIDSEKLS